MLSCLTSSLPIVTAALAVLLAIVYYAIKNRNLPPGPYGLPFLGYWSFLKDESCHLQLHELQKKYGEVFSFTVAGHLLINLGSIETIKDIHITKSECFHRNTEVTLLSMMLGKGIPFLNGDEWKAPRKLFQHLFREYGLASVKNISSEAMYDSLNEIIKEVREKDKKPFNIFNILAEKIRTLVHQTVFSEGGITEEQSVGIEKAYEVFFLSMTGRTFLLHGEFARRIMFPLLPHYKEFRKNMRILHSILQTILKEHEATYNEDNIRDIIHAYLKERYDRQKKGDPTVKYFTDELLTSTVTTILNDGIIAVGLCVAEALKVLLQIPEEQEKIYRELIDVLGTDRQPTMEDKRNLPYTNAFLYEVMRNSESFPMFPSFVCIEETTVNGYRIPKDSITVTNIWSASHDPKVYKDPSKFNPSRFLSTDGKQREELPILFGCGKRACMGENWVTTQLFLFVVTVVKNFQLKLPVSDSPTDFTDIFNVIVCANPREEK